MDRNSYIAVFDSGVGGVSVLRELRALMPGERFYYFGDSANAPYGKRTTAQVQDLTLAAAEKMMAFGLKALVVACNTATSAAIRTLREKYPQMIIVGIEPAVKPAVDQFPNGRIGVMATDVTLREEKFHNLLGRFETGVTIEKISAPGLVELVEAGKADSADALLENILGPYKGLDALVLGCTHYPFVKKTVQKILGDAVQVLDGGAGTARQTCRLLEEKYNLME